MVLFNRVVPGLSTPSISVIGFDDISLDRVAHTNLTTVAVSRDELGRRAGEILEQLLVHGYEAGPVYLPMQLRVRDTSAAPR
ncbi:LacI family transcriptional regulator [Kribbella qitaiheensis]|uniref:LacI family transcriptional regulator n=1 Tax=Kribbella qitaiheensis TaxID=1544730 RepID=A0A7G6X2N0_9ACTN|nr:LacI family transcriptional regulator [Kribbella qitaiheensis]